jgi:hypothetical protein
MHTRVSPRTHLTIHPLIENPSRHLQLAGNGAQSRSQRHMHWQQEVRIHTVESCRILIYVSCLFRFILVTLVWYLYNYTKGRYLEYKM